jgi:hypothetical protein
MKIKTLMKTKLIFSLLLISISSCNKKDIKRPPQLSAPTVNYKFINNDSLKIEWNNIHDSVEYDISFKTSKMLGNSWLAIPLPPVTDTLYSVPFSKLMPATAYVCKLSSLLWPYNIEDKVFTFITPCASIQNIKIDPVGRNTATVYWLGGNKGTPKENLSDIPSFQFYLRKKGTTNNEIYLTTDHFYEIDQLTPGTDYQIRLGYQCTDNQWYYSEWVDFKTRS